MSDATPLPWTLDSIDFSRIEMDRIRPDHDLVSMLCASAFVESGSDLYTSNLVRYFDGDAEVQDWLREHWEPEELQHGRALSTYVRHVWPDFDWDAAFASFFGEYSATCTVEALEPTRGLEMAARCVVETGTASLYRAIHQCTDEPVLKQLTEHIKSDEVRHYSHFYHYFQRYEASERNGRRRVMGALWRRMREIGNADGDTALRHVFAFRPAAANAGHIDARHSSDRIYGLIRRHLPAQMTVKMLLKPLDLPPRLNAGLQSPLTWVAERFVLH
jgi:hypothetical protein